MKLISMTDFVLEEVKKWHANSPTIIINYANFLKQPLELWMFVPCDEDGNVFEEPDQNNTKYDVYISNDEVDCDYRLYDEDCLEYQKSKERCLFYSQHEDKELFDKSLAKFCLEGFFNIEQLANEISDIELTPTAIKKIGL